MKLKFQILILCLASLLLLTVFTYLSLFININRTYKTRIETLKNDLLNDKKKYLNDLVRFAHEIVKESYKDFQKDKEGQNLKSTYKINILEEEYKSKAKNFLAALRYDEGNGYFFAYELRSDDVYYAFHGVKKELWNTVPIPFDRHGYLFRKDIIKEAQKGGGYVIYVEEKPSTKRLTETIAYAEYFKEWDWVIVSSIFMQDIDKKVEILKKELTREQQKTLILFLIILLIVTFFMSIVVILVSNGIVKPLEDITDHANHVSVEGKLTTFTPKGKIMQNTEVGQLVSSFNKMTQALIEAEKSLKEQERLKKKWK